MPNKMHYATNWIIKLHSAYNQLNLHVSSSYGENVASIKDEVILKESSLPESERYQFLGDELSEILDSSFPRPELTREEAIVESFIRNPGSIPSPLVAAVLGRFVDLDVNNWKTEFSGAIKSLGSDRVAAKFLLQTFVETWAEENNFRLIRDEEVTPHIRETRRALETWNSRSKFQQTLSVLRGERSITYTALIEEAEVLAADIDRLKEERARILTENIGLTKQGAKIVEEAAAKGAELLTATNERINELQQSAVAAREKIVTSAEAAAERIKETALREADIARAQINRYWDSREIDGAFRVRQLEEKAERLKKEIASLESEGNQKRGRHGLMHLAPTNSRERLERRREATDEISEALELYPMDFKDSGRSIEGMRYLVNKVGSLDLTVGVAERHAIFTDLNERRLRNHRTDRDWIRAQFQQFLLASEGAIDEETAARLNVMFERANKSELNTFRLHESSRREVFGTLFGALLLVSGLHNSTFSDGFSWDRVASVKGPLEAERVRAILGEPLTEHNDDRGNLSLIYATSKSYGFLVQAQTTYQTLMRVQATTLGEEIDVGLMLSITEGLLPPGISKEVSGLVPTAGSMP